MPADTRKGEKEGPRRLGELIGVPVVYADGRHAGYVNDVRLRASGKLQGLVAELVTEGLVVGRDRHGTLLGYDRRRKQGPLVVRAVVRARYRHSGYVPWAAVRSVEFDSQVVRLHVNSLESLDHA